MGGIPACHWAAMYPELVERAVVVCGSAKTAVHNQVVLRGLLRVLLLPSETDIYFRVADNAAALEHLAHGRLAVNHSIWGWVAT